MSERPPGAGPRALVARLILRPAVALLAPAHHAWGEALEAELETVPPGWPRLQFALSGALGLLVVVVRDAARGRVADAPAVGFALMLGVLGAAVDLTVGSRMPAVLLIGVSCVALGARYPRAAWRWPLLTGGMLPAVITATGHAGPYTHDRGDRWIIVALAAVCTAVGAATGPPARARRHRAARRR